MTNKELRDKLINVYDISCDAITTMVNDKSYDKLQMMLMAVTNVYKTIIDTTSNCTT